MLITHDLGVVAGMTRRVAVMYAGVIVEQASTDDLFADPRMPYTWGLLDSLPRLDDLRGGKLRTIEGLPPLLIRLPDACRFNPRCPYVQDVCLSKEPELTLRSQEHWARCHGTDTNGWIP